MIFLKINFFNLFILWICKFKFKLVNFPKKFRTYIRAIKRRTIGLSYGDTWQGRDNEFFEQVHEHGIKKNEDFVNYLENKNDIHTVLEIGCGTGIYPIQYSHLFENKTYTGIDISKSAINYCKKHSKFTFFVGDFSKMQLSEKYDLVYSHGVINHVSDIDLFLKKTLDVCKKYAYINASHGYFPDLEEHNMKWAKNEAIFNTDMSVKQLKISLTKFGFNKNQFTIRPIDMGENKQSTIIEIKKDYQI